MKEFNLCSDQIKRDGFLGMKNKTRTMTFLSFWIEYHQLVSALPDLFIYIISTWWIMYQRNENAQKLFPLRFTNHHLARISMKRSMFVLPHGMALLPGDICTYNSQLLSDYNCNESSDYFFFYYSKFCCSTVSCLPFSFNIKYINVIHFNGRLSNYIQNHDKLVFRHHIMSELHGLHVSTTYQSKGICTSRGRTEGGSRGRGRRIVVGVWDTVG